MELERKLAELLAIDVTATILLARDAGERMRCAAAVRSSRSGWDQAETGMDGDSGQLFAAAKAAVIGFTKSLAVCRWPRRCASIHSPPAGTGRPGGSGALQPWQERVLAEPPLGRWGTPDDVAAAAVWLSSLAASFVTHGQLIRR